VAKRKYRLRRHRKFQQQQQQQQQLRQQQPIQQQDQQQQVTYSQVHLGLDERTSEQIQRHLIKDKNKEKYRDREKEKDKDKNKDNMNQMAERQANAQERRIHELDQNVERYFEVRKVSNCNRYRYRYKKID